MNLYSLKIFVRNLKKNKFISAINLLGLTIGTLSSLLIFEYVFYERSFDHYHEKGSQVCRIVYNRYQNEKLQWKTANSFFPCGKWLKDNYPEVLDWAVISRKFNIAVSYENPAGDKVFYNEAKTYYASSSLFNLFTIPLVQGTPSCLDKPNTVAVSERTSQKYFGKESALGKLVTVNNSESYTVTAVYRNIPANSHLQTDFLFSLTTITAARKDLFTNWGDDYFNSYILLAPGVNHEEFCKRAMPDMIAKNYLDGLIAFHSRDEFSLQPIPEIHLHSNLEYETEQPGNPVIMDILFGFAIFLLVVAWINYINLTTAQSMERAREIGIKKINGAPKMVLIGQFLSEAFLFNLLSLIITLTIFSLINLSFKEITNIHDFSLFSHKGFVRTGLLVFFSGVIISSIYPALVLSSYKPGAVLKGKFKHSVQGQMIRKSLVAVQFVISIVLLTGTIVTYRQALFLMNKEMGVDFKSSLVIRAPRTSDNLETRNNKFMLFKNRALELPEVADFTFTSDVPGQEINSWYGGRRKGFDGSDDKFYFQIAGDDRFMDFYKIKVLAGRKFHKNESSSQHTILMNRSAIERLGYTKPEDAVNQVLVAGNTEMLIVGVVDDFYYKSIKTEPVPTVITMDDNIKTFLTFKLRNMQAASYSSLASKLRPLYENIFPGQPFEYFSLDDSIRMDLKPDKTFASVFIIFAALAILIAVIGILGLILITVNHSMKELGIRKALGAEVLDMSGLLSKQLLAEFIAALLIAMPLSYYGYKHWFLYSYIHHINLDIWIFVVPVFIMSAVICLVIFLLSARVFLMKVTEVLKYE